MNEVNDIEEQEKDVASVADAQQPSKESQPKPVPKGMISGGKTLEDVIQREAKEEQDTTSPFSLSKTLGGVIIERAVHRQVGLLLLICAFLIIYISNRYVCQQRMVDIDRLESMVQQERYKATVFTSRLTEKSRESNIMGLLKSYGDSTLAIPQDPPYLIRVEE